MKILYVCDNYESVQSHLTESFTNKKNSVQILHYSITGKRLLSDNNKTEIETIIPGIKAKGPVFYIMALVQVTSLFLKKLDFSEKDIIHGNMLFCDGFICRKISKKYSIPYMISVRDTDLHLWFLWKLPWIKNMGFKNLENASRIVFLSRTYKEIFLKKLPQSIKNKCISKISVIPNGIDQIFIENSYKKTIPPKENNIRLIYVGRVIPRKNVELTIEACEKLHLRGYNVNFSIVGKIETDYYQSLIESTPFVEYHEKCEKKRVLQLLRESDIFVMPSHTETFGLTYVEAMSQGLPVLYTRGQGFDGQFEEGVVGYHVSDCDSAEIADRIEDILNDYLIISNRCTELSMSFTWSNIADIYLEEYEKCIQLYNDVIS